MILGIGIDLIDIRRIEEALANSGEKFEQRIFTQAECDKAHSRAGAGAKIVASTYAKRFAAKEACIKALATRHITWHDMEITNSDDGVPMLTLHNDAKKRLESMTPAGHTSRIFLTMTDAYPFAQAQVIFTAEPNV
jgi:holo-[acyl-carrier protein] synthase